ncbi:hypothetical protein BC830DRAFT_1118387 [Chytriomyces sp. MP71]|nr:hypothetical protein BC830DRAFT_1118387 [Chytriomyces sp. MP71]
MVSFPFTSTSARVASCLYAISFGIGVTLNSALLYSIVREPKVRTKKIDQANLLVIVGTFLWSISCVFFNIRAQMMGGFDQFGCNGIGFSIGLAAVAEIAGQALMAFERYLIVVHKKQATILQFVCVFSPIVLLNLIVSCIELLPSLQYEPMDGASWCFFPFDATDPVRKAMSVAIAVICVGSLCGTFYAYLCIFLHVRKEAARFLAIAGDVIVNGQPSAAISMEVDAKQASSSVSVTKIGSNLGNVGRSSAIKSSTSAKDKISEQSFERQIFIRCAAIMICFLACFGLEFMIFLYQAIWSNKPPELLGQIATVMSVADSYMVRRPYTCDF